MSLSWIDYHFCKLVLDYFIPFNMVAQKILSRSSDGMPNYSKSGVFTGQWVNKQWNGCLLSKHVREETDVNHFVNLLSEEVEMNLLFFGTLSGQNVYKIKMFVKWLKAWEWWQGDLWPQVATKNYWTEGEPLAPRSYQLMIALVLSSPKTQNSFQLSRPEIDVNNDQHPCIKYQKNHQLKIC